ncbi:winged helix-turn-helix transcriptional regulator [Pectobacterium carotovorum]|uniref:winged helix-turn-helix transcriptional regulator n=1 Tax=Pectobacterium carotovorum TaxID=554 RepID=UPI00057FD209|nr:helix-turn-helix domain-containing protein [Pectobacterium carotovorum]KAA3665731.1 helix-turn-helix transcriptional regulator [Pectobacterium carotovorum subsp. carotovorum]KHT26555.1 HxlR family transcriptional regulator [Pectobacterium carotovorum subsp. carotovorum]MBA0181376.1 helix-turn-helix transcriptional regulator [Pectobacterium carotovorum]MBL0910095.1 helix-turn-helix transcriptional regulator [Pectobacterium carotovorum]MDY4375170.1 helix-turn-helix domain-containing protein [
MVKRKSLKEDACPVARALDVVGDRWALLIIRDAFDNRRRFGDFQRSLGVAKNILTDRLRTLVEEGILSVQPVSESSAYQEYILTPKGEQLFPLVVALRQWGEQQLFAEGEPHSLLLDKHTGQPLQTMLPHSVEGQLVVGQDTFVQKVD